MQQANQKIWLLLVVALWLIVFPGLGNCTQLPSFLPAFYSEAFKKERELVLVRQTNKEGGEQYLYRTEDNAFFLSVENIKADAPKVTGVMQNLLRFLNNEMGAEGGEFIRIGSKEVHARLPCSVELRGNYVTPATLARSRSGNCLSSTMRPGFISRENCAGAISDKTVRPAEGGSGSHAAIEPERETGISTSSHGTKTLPFASLAIRPNSISLETEACRLL